jgi:oligopeptide/dipeptide ABC transporter ATP-binding protein
VSEHTQSPLLEVTNLQTHFHTDAGIVKSVNDVSFVLYPGETLAVVGESGSGKSVTSLSIMGLIPNPPGRIVGGQIRFRRAGGDVVDLVQLPARELRQLRGKEIAMIFQEPMTSLNPVFTVGDQIAETVQLHLGKSRTEALIHARRMLDMVEIPAAAQRLHEYPHQLSGGMRQRVMIALALSCNPSLLIADEPTTALDVTIQAQILMLLEKLQAETGTSILFITHNLGVVAEIADRVAVMYSGSVVEQGTVRQLFKAPRHPYTQGLLNCLPSRALASRETCSRESGSAGRPMRLNAIPGQVASPLHPLPGCPFAPRCHLAESACQTALPRLFDIADGQRSRCLRWSEV